MPGGWEEGYLRGEVEVASLLTASGIPVVGVGLVEGVEGLELYPILLFVMLAYVHQIMCKLLIALGTQIVLPGIFMSATTSAEGHVIRSGVAECLKDGIGSALLYLEHNLALGLIPIPVPAVFGGILEAFHLGTQTFTFTHMVGSAVAVHGILATTYIISEYAEVESLWTYQPIH